MGLIEILVPVSSMESIIKMDDMNGGENFDPRKGVKVFRMGEGTVNLPRFGKIVRKPMTWWLIKGYHYGGKDIEEFLHPITTNIYGRR